MARTDAIVLGAGIVGRDGAQCQSADSAAMRRAVTSRTDSDLPSDHPPDGLDGNIWRIA